MKQASRSRISPDAAYILPMAVFLALTTVGGQWPSLYPLTYIVKTILVAASLVFLWPHYTKIRWDYWWLGLIMGVVGIVQWIGMEKLLLHWFPQFPEISVTLFDPLHSFSFAKVAWSFIALRWADAVLVVPVMEELFWRDFLWRTIAAPADFKLASIGEWDRGLPILAVSVAFCLVHPQWLIALVWGLMIGSLLIYTRSLGACILMHAVTNLLLGGWVLYFHDWRFW